MFVSLTTVGRMSIIDAAARRQSQAVMSGVDRFIEMSRDG